MTRLTRSAYALSLTIRSAQYRINVRQMTARDWLDTTDRTREMERLNRRIFNIVMRGWA